MGTLVVTLHVLTAMFFIGPLALAPFVGLRALVRRDADGIRRASRTTVLLATGSGSVFLLGLAAAGLSKRISLDTPWLTASATLSAIAVVAVLLVAAPGLRSVAALIEAGITADGRTRARLDALRGRIGMSATLAAAAWMIVVVLMTVKPFS